MARLERDPTFLPLTISATSAVAAATARTPTLRAPAERVRDRARRADAAAAECWAALCAGCDAPGRRALPNRLRELSEATSDYAGTRWWFGRGSQHRERLSSALARIEEAVAERDGADFAEAFVGYDQAVATVLVNSHSRLETPAP
ncbi:sugar ABC transporter substrate-binding protein [Actinophytocola gossypii]|uniref:sugar ABC transporter substrate-binding protein n=1 Tax=Actinophytocola gossypii TaxID=2812003 RepID=UPI0021A70F03|nr:sugar ABC transporter substrate-binding protein [Actinophytocola gossypii]